MCGLDHTLALSQTGTAYAFGDNSLCQLGRVGNMGVQTPTTTTADDWIIHDEDHEPILFTKVVWPVSLAMMTCMVGLIYLCIMLWVNNDCKGQ